MIDAGKLRHRVYLEAPEADADGQGGLAETTWRIVAMPWAEIEPVKVTEAEYAQGRRGGITHRVRIRYRSGVHQAMRLRYAGRILEIEGPPRDLRERREYLELICREVSP